MIGAFFSEGFIILIIKLCLNNDSGLQGVGPIALVVASFLLAIGLSESILLQEITHSIMHFTHMSSQSLASFKDFTTYLAYVCPDHMSLLDHLVQSSLSFFGCQKSTFGVSWVVPMDLLAVFSFGLVLRPAFFLPGFKFRNLKFP